jgi:hypothetical protein
MCTHRDDFAQYTSLPSWAQATLAKHAADPREPLYSPEALDAADTYDPIWNAAQRQLRREGRLHNYLRMLWGKKILQWSATPEQALLTMIDLNNRYAVDGRDPNSYSGIFWTLGRYDRPWPERKVFGTIRHVVREHGAEDPAQGLSDGTPPSPASSEPESPRSWPHPDWGLTPVWALQNRAWHESLSFSARCWSPSAPPPPRR